MIHIDRCYCFDVLFSTLLSVSNATGARTIEELQTMIRFGEQCELCHSYVRRALETGQVVFHDIIEPGG